MKRVFLIGFLLLSACKPAPQAAQAPAGPGGPPGPLPSFLQFQTRDQVPSGDRLASGRDGKALFSNHCGSCHLDGGMGTNLLTKQMLAAKRPPTDGMLANRLDLTSDYVKSVVRMGKMAMPRLSRVEVTDAELESISHYLGKADK
jgi:mono/diheme cytochrome c family protein